MNFPQTRKYAALLQYALCLSMVIVVALVCFFFIDKDNYTMVALILLMVVSVIAMLFDILPVLTACILSALIWNYFFISPIFTFHIGNYQDGLMFSLYFVIALVNAVLSYNIRKAEKKARDKDEKEKTIKLYNTLLNSLSHELRTPISTIIGAVDTLKDQKGLSTSNKDILLDEIDSAGMRLNRQVENLLNMSRLESGIFQHKYDWCDINEVINDLINKIKPNENNRIIFRSEPGLPLLKLDRGLVEQIIHNILHNALLYTPHESIISINLFYIKGNCRIEISDKGEGLPQSEIKYIFDKFYRSPNNKTGGSGLGLSIVKGFAEAMNGTVGVRNNQDKGLTFVIELPAASSYINNLKNE